MLRSLLLIIFSFLSFSLLAQPDADKPTLDKAQVITQDLVVQGSECVGFDCVNGESFGFDTQRYKENNLRIHFFDTSNSASFPSNDWRIVINDTSNGGANYFGIEDATAARMPFRVEAGAPANTLYVDASGDVGIKTANPVVDLHVVEGNTPTLRLEQDGSDGFTPQTWDLAGNEANFFIRDVTNGSKLPFRIQPGALDNSIYVATDGDIGLGTTSPATSLHIAGTGGSVNHQIRIAVDNENVGFRLQTENAAIANTGDYAVLNLRGGRGDAIFSIRDVSANTWNQAFAYEYIDREFNVAGTVASNGMVLTSDKKLKKNIKSLDRGLAEVMKIAPVTYEYTGKNGTKKGDVHMGVLAQNLQKIMPELVVSKTHYEYDEEYNKVVDSNDYLAIKDNEIKWVLVNAIQEQQKEIEQLKRDNEEKISALKDEIAELRDLIVRNSVAESVKGNNAFLGQNEPNPFKNVSLVNYQLPEGYKKAQVLFHSIDGTLIKSVNLVAQSGSIDIAQFDELTSGQYIYSLVVDNRIVQTRKMVAL